jgi:hypothetical protein
MSELTANLESPMGVPSGAAPIYLTASEFFTGLLAGLRLETPDGNLEFAADRRFNNAVGELFKEFKDEAATVGVETLFRISVDPIYGDSEIIDSSLAEASGRNLIRFFNPSYSKFDLRLSHEEAKRTLLKYLPTQLNFCALAVRLKARLGI